VLHQRLRRCPTRRLAARQLQRRQRQQQGLRSRHLLAFRRGVSVHKMRCREQQSVGCDELCAMPLGECIGERNRVCRMSSWELRCEEGLRLVHVLPCADGVCRCRRHVQVPVPPPKAGVQESAKVWLHASRVLLTACAEVCGSVSQKMRVVATDVVCGSGPRAVASVVAAAAHGSAPRGAR
jgi:hypothetical protein